MDIDIQKLLVGLFVLVPGFIATSAENAISPKRYSSTLERIIDSLLKSLVVNLFAIICFYIYFLLSGSNIINESIRSISKNLADFEITTAAAYLFFIYVVAGIWGIFSGSFPLSRFNRALNAAAGSAITTHDSVWYDMFYAKKSKSQVRQTEGWSLPNDKPETWIQLTAGDGRTYFGRLRKSSVFVDREKPIETLLSPAFECTGNSHLTPIVVRGQNIEATALYLRVRKEDVISIYRTQDEWRPILLN